METRPRVRAGAPSLQPMLDLHRVTIDEDMPVQFAGKEPDHTDTASVEDEDGGTKMMGWVVLWCAFLGALWLVYQVAPMVWGLLS